jgi:hypothetical protein
MRENRKMMIMRPFSDSQSLEHRAAKCFYDSGEQDLPDLCDLNTFQDVLGAVDDSGEEEMLSVGRSLIKKFSQGWRSSIYLSANNAHRDGIDCRRERKIRA